LARWKPLAAWTMAFDMPLRSIVRTWPAQQRSAVLLVLVAFGSSAQVRYVRST